MPDTDASMVDSRALPTAPANADNSDALALDAESEGDTVFAPVTMDAPIELADAGGPDSHDEVCRRTSGSVVIRVGPYNGTTYACPIDRVGLDVAPGAAFTLGGVVTSASEASDGGVVEHKLLLETCPPGQDCRSSVVPISVASPGWAGAAPFIPAGTFIGVDYTLAVGFGCAQSIAIRNLPSWNGTPNPTWPDGRTLFVGSDGFEPPLVGASAANTLSVSKAPLHCFDAGAGCGATRPDEYRLIFSTNSPTGRSVSVAMGQSAVWALDGHPVSAVNLRSYQDAICDDYMNWAYVIVAIGQ